MARPERPHFERFVQAILDIAVLRRCGKSGDAFTEACREASERAYWDCTPDERKLCEALCIAIDGKPEGGEVARCE